MCTHIYIIYRYMRYSDIYIGYIYYDLRTIYDDDIYI